MPITSKKVVLSFNSSEADGWTETYWFNGSVTAGAIPGPVTALISARATCLCATVSIDHVRVSTGINRNPSVAVPGGGSGVTGGFAAAPSEDQIAIQIRLDSSVKGFGRIFLRGVPADQVLGGIFKNTDPFKTALQTFLSFLVSSGSFNVVGTLGSPDTQYPITDMQPTIPRGIQFTSNLLPAAAGDEIKIHAAQTPGYNGVKTVRGIITGPPKVFFCGGAAPTSNDQGAAAYATTITTYDNPITSARAMNATRHKTGRPFGLQPGRRPTLYSLRR